MALRLVQSFPRQYVRDITFSGPRGVLSARAHEMAGNTVAAQADWRATLQQCDVDLAANASDVTALYWKAWALARLGDQAEAQSAATLLRQGLQTAQNNYIGSYNAAALWATVGWTDEAISTLQTEIQNPSGFITLTRAHLELEPAFDPIRNDPRDHSNSILRNRSTHPMGSAHTTRPSPPCHKPPAHAPAREDAPGRPPGAIDPAPPSRQAMSPARIAGTI